MGRSGKSFGNKGGPEVPWGPSARGIGLRAAPKALGIKAVLRSSAANSVRTEVRCRTGVFFRKIALVRSGLPLNARFHSGGSEYFPLGIQPCECTFPLWRFGLFSAGASIPPRARLLLPSERLEISRNCTCILGRCASGSERNCARSFRENREAVPALLALALPGCRGILISGQA